MIGLGAERELSTLKAPKKQLDLKILERAEKQSKKLAEARERLVVAREAKQKSEDAENKNVYDFSTVWLNLWNKYYEGTVCTGITLDKRSKVFYHAKDLNKFLKDSNISPQVFLEWVFSNWLYVVNNDKFTENKPQFPTVTYLLFKRKFILNLWQATAAIHDKRVPKELRQSYLAASKDMPHEEALEYAKSKQGKRSKFKVFG